MATRQGQHPPVGQSPGLLRVVQHQGHPGLGVPEVDQLAKDRVDLAPAPGPVQVLAQQGPGRGPPGPQGPDPLRVNPAPADDLGRIHGAPGLDQWACHPTPPVLVMVKL